MSIYFVFYCSRASLIFILKSASSYSLWLFSPLLRSSLSFIWLIKRFLKFYYLANCSWPLISSLIKILSFSLDNSQSSSCLFIRLISSSLICLFKSPMKVYFLSWSSSNLLIISELSAINYNSLSSSLFFKSVSHYFLLSTSSLWFLMAS